MSTAIPSKPDTLLDSAEPDYLYEVIDGRYVEKTTGVYENWLAGVIFSQLDAYAVRSSVGHAVIETMFDLRPRVNRERRPDAAFVTFVRWPRDRGIPETRSWAVVPDLAVEVLSATNTAGEVAEKVEEYFAVGVRLVWVVYPVQKKIYAYTSTNQVRVLGLQDEIDGGEVLQGFRLPVRELFDTSRGSGSCGS